MSDIWVGIHSIYLLGTGLHYDCPRIRIVCSSGHASRKRGEAIGRVSVGSGCISNALGERDSIDVSCNSAIFEWLRNPYVLRMVDNAMVLWLLTGRPEETIPTSRETAQLTREDK